MNKQEAERKVETWITDHGYDRARGDKTSAVDMLRAKLVEALTDPPAPRTQGGR